MKDDLTCPRCEGEMEEGNVITMTGGIAGTWVKKGKVALSGMPTLSSYSCLKCGYIESYVKR